MSFVSILRMQEPGEVQKKKEPDYFVDLNLNQIIDRIQKHSPDYLVKELFYDFPSQEDILYRQDVYQDMKQPVVYKSFYKFSEYMRRSAEKVVSPTFSGEELQASCWQVEGAYFYCKAIRELQEDLEKGSAEQCIKSQGLRALHGYLTELISESSFERMQQEAYRIWGAFSDLKFTLDIKGDKVVISKAAQEGTYEDFLKECFQEYETVDKGSMHSPYVVDLFLSGLEKKLLQAYFGKYPELEKDILKFARTYQEYKEEKLLRLEQEVQFYLAYYRFQQECKGMGAEFARPVLSEEKRLQAQGVYDLALACKNLPEEKEVVSNDFIFQQGEQFFVVNGPNQGGKTTFARSLGQLIYFTKMGLEVNARSANIYYFQRLVTHFSVEESMESGQGKLMEELRRLAPIMNKGCNRDFVIINELFTTAAHYDGCVMGARVLDYFVKRNCCGVYVTHLRALGDDSEGVVRMAAMLDGSEEHRRTYKILRSEASVNGYAEDIVNRYQLTYESLHSRLESYGKEEGGQVPC